MFENWPLPAFGSTVASQDLEEGQMGLVEVKEQLTRDSLHQQPLREEGASYGNGRLGNPSNFQVQVEMTPIQMQMMRIFD